MPPHYSRRTALRIGGTVLGGWFAGCTTRSDGTGSPDGQTDSDTVSRRGTGTVSTRTNSPNAGAPSVILRTSYRFFYETDLVGVWKPERDQFAFVTPPAAAPTPPPDQFTLELDDERFSPRPMEAAVLSAMPELPDGVNGIYFADGPHGTPGSRRTGALLFDVPNRAVDSAALLHDGTRYPLPDESLPPFATAPDFHVESTSVSELNTGEAVTLSVTVSNRGDRDGLYLAGGWISANPQTLDVRVPKGESKTGTVSWNDFRGTAVHFAYPGGTREVTAEDGTAQPTATE